MAVFLNPAAAEQTVSFKNRVGAFDCSKQIFTILGN